MKLSSRFGLLAVFALALLLCPMSFAQEKENEWRLVTPEEMAMKVPKVEPDADAEAIFWEVRLDDKSDSKLTYSHYVRVKIFTERGRERFSKMDIPFAKGKKVEGVMARVIKPDGTMIELKPEDIFEREIAKADKKKVLAKSFAVPGIEPGVIVEYRYTEKIEGDSASGERLYFQRDIPMQKVVYYVRPHADTTLSFHPYNMEDTRFLEGKKGFRVGTMTDVPALKEEPYMPPDSEVRRWVYLRYVGLATLFQWSFVSGGWTEELKKRSKPNKEVKAKAAELTAGVQSDEEKVRRIYDFVQKNIKNVHFDPSYDEKQIKKLDVKDADDALKKGMGNSYAIDMLFASLARASGFETNVILAADRSDIFFEPRRYPFPNFIGMSGVAVKIGNEWRYFDPCTPYHPFGQMEWQKENMDAMLIGDGGYVWKKIPVAAYESSSAKRTAKLNLSADGSLEGTVRIEYNGHQALSRRRDQFRDSQSKREENIKEDVTDRIGSAEISGLTIENFDDSSKPLVYNFTVKVPNYAQKAGKRLIVQPGFFEYGSSPVFSSATRKYAISFPYPLSESDEIDIQLPNGFEIDAADAPEELFDPSRIGGLKITMGIARSSNVLKYKREFHFGGGGKILFPASVYAPLKNLFDAFHKADSHAVSIKQSAK
ncbi:MAG: DUF3857 and transglutaminase domain-containing protein [Pyrinomonadaceae bacterium]